VQAGTSRQLKDNRLVALTLENKQEDRFIKVSELALSDRQVVRGWLKGFDKKILLSRWFFTNQDGSTGTLNLICSDLSCDGIQDATTEKNSGKSKRFTSR